MHILVRICYLVVARSVIAHWVLWGHQLGSQGPQDQLEGFDQLEIGLDLGQLEIGLDMICYDLIGPSLGGQESSLFKGR